MNKSRVDFCVRLVAFSVMSALADTCPDAGDDHYSHCPNLSKPFVPVTFEPIRLKFFDPNRVEIFMRQHRCFYFPMFLSGRPTGSVRPDTRPPRAIFRAVQRLRPVIEAEYRFEPSSLSTQRLIWFLIGFAVTDKKPKKIGTVATNSPIVTRPLVTAMVTLRYHYRFSFDSIVFWNVDRFSDPRY